jgi:pimeloyl-ACP methyl ester carboxylesterase
MSNIVLVPGAFHGAWCWRAVVERLRADGHGVYPLTLTGLGERAHLIGAQVNLDTHIADIVNAIEAEELDDVVLVAHSYGGMPMTGAADRLSGRLRALVFLDAFTPENGDSAVTVRSAVPGFIPLPEPEDGFSNPCPPAEIFGLTGELAGWAERRLSPHPLTTMTQPVRLSGAWRNVAKKVYIRMNYPAPYFDKYYESHAADPAWTAIRHDGPHNIMMTDPDWFVGVLREHAL